MSDPEIFDPERTERLRKIAIACYALYALSPLLGLSAIAALIIAYIKRDEASGSWLASHFSWQIRTFWFGLLWAAISVALTFVLIGIPLMFVLAVWSIYRIAKGWLAAYERKPVFPSRLL